MAAFKQNLPYNTRAELLKPSYETVKGVKKKIYPDSGEELYCSFKTYGGTETNVNGVYSIINTANVETWFRPDIKSDCMLLIDGIKYEIISKPENIDMKNVILLCKVKAVTGGA